MQAQAASAYAQLQATTSLSSQQLAGQPQARGSPQFPAVNGWEGAAAARSIQQQQQQQQLPGYAASPFPQQHQQQAALTRLLQQMNGNAYAAPNSAHAASAAAAAAQLQVRLSSISGTSIQLGMRELLALVSLLILAVCHITFQADVGCEMLHWVSQWVFPDTSRKAHSWVILLLLQAIQVIKPFWRPAACCMPCDEPMSQRT